MNQNDSPVDFTHDPKKHHLKHPGGAIIGFVPMAAPPPSPDPDAEPDADDAHP